MVPAFIQYILPFTNPDNDATSYQNQIGFETLELWISQTQMIDWNLQLRLLTDIWYSWDDRGDTLQDHVRGAFQGVVSRGEPFQILDEFIKRLLHASVVEQVRCEKVLLCDLHIDEE